MSSAITAERLYEPETLTRMAAAFEAALTIAADGESPFSVVPAYALRRRLAGLVLEGANEGLTDVDLLKAFALRGLAGLIVQAETPPVPRPGAVPVDPPAYADLCA